MGLGASKIDYKERNFTEQPLDDQEINILLQALPEENVIGSIESKGREKILRSMSDQKVFNIKGDNIFDYYFTNNKDELKSCMTSHINRDGTPCPDEKFKRMITRIPDLVKGPLGEKENQWDTEKTNLKSQYDTLNTEKTDLKSQYDTLNTEKTDLKSQYDTLNTEKTDLKSQYDTLNTEKTDLQTQYDELNTQKGDLQTQYDELNTEKTDLKSQYDTLNTEKTDLKSQYDTLNTEKTDLQSQYDTLGTQKDGLEDEILKNLLSNVVRVTDGNNINTVSEQQCKAYAKSLGTTMGKGNDTSGCYLAPSGVGTSGVYYNKKTGKGKCYYNSDSDYRVCIQNNLNRNNTYSKKGCRGDVGGEYDCRVDGTWDQITLKGWDRNKYGQTIDAAKHFCNTHKDCVAVASSSANWNWPVHTTSKFKPCHNEYKDVTSGKPDMSVSETECDKYAVSVGKEEAITTGNFGNPQGCFKMMNGNVYFMTAESDIVCDSVKTCVQKGNNCDPKMNYHNKRECKKPIDGVWSKGVGESCEWECPGRSGVESYSVPKFKTTKNAYACSARDYTYDKNKKAFSGGNRKLVPGRAYACKSQTNAVYGWSSYAKQSGHFDYLSSCSDWDNPAMFYKTLSNNEEPLSSVSEEECKAYADTHGYTYGVPWVTLKNVWSIGTKTYYKENIDKDRYKTGKYYANDCGSKWMSSDVIDSCSKGYGSVAKTSANAVYGADQNREFSSDKDPKGCFLNDKNVYFNKNTSTNAVCDSNKKCIQGELTKEDFKTVSSGKPSSKYKEVSSGKNNRSVSESECKAYAETIPGYGYSTVTNTDRPHGCYHSGKQYRYATNGNLDCGTSTDICIQKDPDNVSEQQCKAYAKILGKELRTDVTDRLSGCSVGYDTPNSRDKIGMVYYGPQGNNNTCGSKFSGNSYFSDCVQIK